MKTKLGQAVPAELANAIQKNEQMLTMWDKLRPSCQRGYVRYYAEAKKPDTRLRRVERILKLTVEYYQRHRKATTA